MTKIKRLKPEYAEALLFYAITTEPLKSITDRLGLPYHKVGNYIRYNYPLVNVRHKELLRKNREKGPEARERKVVRSRSKIRPEKVEKYAESVALLQELKTQQYNVIQKVAAETGLNYHALRLHVYTYYRELIGLDPAKNKSKAQLSPHTADKYSKAIELLASEPIQPENNIRYVSDQLGLPYHALRSYIYTHHPDLTQKRRKGKSEY